MGAKHLFAALVLTGACASGTQAVSADPVEIRCEATLDLSCGDENGCASERHAQALPIAITYSPETRRGDLCTYTYCRGFELLAPPSAPGQTRDGHSGFTLSEHAGSTPELQNRSVVDFQLTFAEDFSRFALVNVQDGGVGGWAGACTAGGP
jgi:hypothetical protein